MAKFNTTIRIGAAHYDLHMNHSGVEVKVDLSKELWGLPPRDRLSRLAGIADIICKVHDIKAKQAPTPVAQPRRNSRSPKRPYIQKATGHEMSMSMVVHREHITREATI